jgi:hypothetical protein
MVELNTKLIPRQATPKKIAIRVVIVRWPYLLKRLPITPIIRPAKRVPIEYMLETRDLLQLKSWI